MQIIGLFTEDHAEFFSKIVSLLCDDQCSYLLNKDFDSFENSVILPTVVIRLNLLERSLEGVYTPISPH